MRKKIFIITLIIVSPIIIYFTFRPDIDEYFFVRHVIFWSEDVNINFSDYQQNPDNNSNLNISYFHGFYLLAKDNQTANVRAYFDKNQSWVKDTTKMDIVVEKDFQQLIFDLNEVYARKYNAKIEKIRNDPDTTFKVLRDIGDEIYKEKNIIENKLYSGENSTKERLAKWRPIINELLEKSKQTASNNG